MKIIDFMFLCLCKMYSRTNPALIDYLKPQNRAVWTIAIGGILWLVGIYYFFIIYTINTINYTPAKLLIPAIVLFALWGLLYYLFYKRYVSGFSDFMEEYKSLTATQMFWGIMLTVAFFILPVILLVLKQLTLKK